MFDVGSSWASFGEFFYLCVVSIVVRCVQVLIWSSFVGRLLCELVIRL